MIRSIEIFRDLPEDELVRIADSCRWTRFGNGRQIIGQADSTTDVFLVLEGSVRAKGFSAHGKEVSYRDIPAGGLFGEFSAIDSEPRSSSVITLSDALVGRMSGEEFCRVLMRNPDVAMALLKNLVTKVRSLTARVFEYSTLPVGLRVHTELVRLAEAGTATDDGIVIEPAPTHLEIANRIATHREAVTRELNFLAAQGIVTLQRGRIVLIDPEWLRREIEQVIG